MSDSPDCAADYAPGESKPPSQRQVLFFITSIAIAVILVAAGVVYTVLNGNNQEMSNNRQWCTVLNLLTAHPVPYPSDPSANPSRVETWQLYEDFSSLKHSFSC